MITSEALLPSIAMVEAVLLCVDDCLCFFVTFRAALPHGIGACDLDASGFSFDFGFGTQVFARTGV